MSTIKSESYKLAPIRSLNDFLLDGSKYLAPTFSDLKRFNNRVTSNLLYYQTNYIGLTGIVFLLFLVFGFNKMFAGAFGIASTAAVVLFALDRIPQVSSLKQQYPIAVFGLGALDLFIVYATFRPILFFCLSLLVPIALSIIHAGVRSRSLKNKISNKVEQLGGAIYSNTPMGFVLSTLGFETKDYEE